MTADAEVLVVGGGPAGAAAAILLAPQGREVLVVEREAEPHDKVCGEFLSAEAQMYLGRLGLDLDALGAVPVQRARLISRERHAEVALPFSGRSLSRRRLDEALLTHAACRGAELLRGRRVVDLAREEGAWRARLDDGRQITARAAFLATGKHDLRPFRRPRGIQNDLIGLKQRLWLTAPTALDGAVELFLFDGGYAGLEPIEDGAANLCLVVQRERFARLACSWSELLRAIGSECPAFRRRLDGVRFGSGRPAAIARIPYGLVRWRSDGLWRVGDQAAVTPSFTGDGMSMALHGAFVAAPMYLSGASPEAFQRRLALDLVRPVWLATAASVLSARPALQLPIIAAIARFPGLAKGLAQLTRVPRTALGRVIGNFEPIALKQVRSAIQDPC